MKSNSKIVTGAVSATNASSVTAQFDCTGYNFVKIVAFGNTTEAASTQNCTIVESETSGGTTTSAITHAQITQNTAATTTSGAKMTWAIPMQGRKPFLKATFTPAATGQYWIVAEMSDAYDTANSRTQAAVGSYYGV